MIKDTFGRRFRDLRISVTDRCNFRCPYCMPAEIYGERYQFLPRADLLTFEEISRLTRIFVELGAAKVRLTGGEPLVRNELEKLIALLADIEGVEDLTLTTNGYLLPQKAQALKDAGLRRVTISMDSLDDEVFRHMNGRGFGTEEVLKGIEAAERGRASTHQGQRGRPARSQRPYPSWSRPSHEGARSHSEVHRVHGRRDAQRLEAGRGRAGRRDRRHDRRGTAPGAG